MTNDGRYAYVWDNADRLKEVRTLDNSLVMSCRYDGLGRRRERIVSPVAGVADPGTNRYVYHEWAVLEVRDGENNVLEAYTHGPDLSGALGGAGGIGGILSVSTGATAFASSWFHYDGNGNVIRLTDATREIVSSLEYSPFGTVLLKSGPYTPRYQFSSKEFDAVVGLNYYGFRYYNPELGRWLSRDPLSEVAHRFFYGETLAKSERRRFDRLLRQGEYRYVDNAPSMRIDPHGLQWYEPPILPPDGSPDPSNPIFDCLFALAQAYIDAFNCARDGNCDDNHLHCVTSCELANDCGTSISYGAGVLKEAIDILFHGGPLPLMM